MAQFSGNKASSLLPVRAPLRSARGGMPPGGKRKRRTRFRALPYAVPGFRENAWTRCTIFIRPRRAEVDWRQVHSVSKRRIGRARRRASPLNWAWSSRKWTAKKPASGTGTIPPPRGLRHNPVIPQSGHSGYRARQWKSRALLRMFSRGLKNNKIRDYARAIGNATIARTRASPGKGSIANDGKKNPRFPSLPSHLIPAQARARVFSSVGARRVAVGHGAGMIAWPAEWSHFDEIRFRVIK